MEKSFRLISDELLAIAKEAYSQPDSSPLKQWASSYRLADPSKVLDFYLGDEKDLLSLASEMVQDSFVSSEKAHLEKVFLEASRDLDSYLLFALQTYRLRALKYLGQLESSDEAVLERRIIKAQASSEKYFKACSDILDELDDLNSKTPHDLVPKFLTSNERKVLKRKGKVSVDGDVFAARLDAIRLKKIDSMMLLKGRVEFFDQEVFRLKNELALLRSLKPILERFNERLMSMVPSVPETVVESSVPMVVSSFVETPVKPSKKGIKRKHRKKSVEPEVNNDDDEEKDLELPYCPQEVSLKLIQRAIDTASGSIAVVLPKTMHDRFVKNWPELLRAMGFNGEVKFIGYEGIATAKMPVLMAQSMNTHTEKWSGEVLIIPEGSPRLLLNHYKSRPKN